MWRTTAGQPFQNYRVRFTLLNADSAPRTWIRQILAGDVGQRMFCAVGDMGAVRYLPAGRRLRGNRTQQGGGSARLTRPGDYI